MKEDLLGTWRRLLRVKKPCSPPSLLSTSLWNSGTLSLQDPDDMSLLVADSTSCGTKFSLLLSWVTSMLFPPSSIITSSLSLSLSLSETRKKNKTAYPSMFVELEPFVNESQKHKHTKKQYKTALWHPSMFFFCWINTLLCWAWTFVIWYTKTWGSVTYITKF